MDDLALIGINLPEHVVKCDFSRIIPPLTFFRMELGLAKRPVPTKAKRADRYVHQAAELRMEAGLSMEELAGKAQVGRTTVSNVEKGLPVTRLSAAKVLRALAAAIGRPLAEADYVKTESPDKSG